MAAAVGLSSSAESYLVVTQPARLGYSLSPPASGRKGRVFRASSVWHLLDREYGRK